VTWLDANVYQDDAGNGLYTSPMSAELNPYSYIDPLLAAQLNDSADSTMYASILIMVLNLGLSLVFGGSLDAMWTMVNTVQMVSLLPLKSVPYPENVIIFFSMLLSSHAEPGWLPNIISESFLRREMFTERAYSSYYEEYGFETTMFLINSGKKIVILFMMLGFYPFCIFMDNRYADKHPGCKIWTKIRSKFTYSLPLRTFLIAYLSFNVTSTLNIMDMPLVTFEDNFSAFTALIFSVILVYAPV
jgi:hypothetical protein